MDYSEYLTYSSSIPSHEPEGNNIFKFKALKGGAESFVRITLAVDAPLPYTLEQFPVSLELDIPGSPSLTAGEVIQVKRPVIQIGISGPAVAPYPGNTMQYNLSLKNHADYPATNLVIKHTFDTAVDFVASDGWTSTDGGRAAIYNLANLADGETANLNPLNVEVKQAKLSYSNTAAVSSYQTSVQTASLSTSGHAVPLTMTASPTVAFPGRSLEYTVNYTNNGGVIYNATIEITTLTAFTFQSRTVNGAGCSNPWNFNEATRTWTCAQLSAGATGSLKITGNVTAENNSYINVQAKSGGDGAVSTWTMSTPLKTYVARPVLRVEADATPIQYVNPGANLTYTYYYLNTGYASATNVQLKNTLPAEVTFVSCTGGCTNSAGQLTWNLGTLAKNATGSVTVTVAVNGDAGGKTIVNGTFSLQSTELSTSETEKGYPVSTQVISQGSKVFLPNVLKNP
jgi:uncharacterized repeat protein (TIGR01451 family)